MDDKKEDTVSGIIADIGSEFQTLGGKLQDFAVKMLEIEKRKG